MFTLGLRGRLWCEVEQQQLQQWGSRYGERIGIKIGLECLKLVTEDCTDSDFNAKISTWCQNEVLISLNKVLLQFLPPLYALLLDCCNKVCTVKPMLPKMDLYLESTGQTVRQIMPDEMD